MKKLYTFKGKIGEDVHEFGLKKPNRTEVEDIEIFYSAMLSRFMSRGVQTRAAVDKYYADNCDGAMTKDDEKTVYKLRQQLAEKEDELISSVGKEKKDERVRLYTEIMELTEKIRNFNEYYSSIYDNTAEIKSRNKTIDYCFLNFSLIGEDSLFKSDEDDDQKRMIEQFDQMEKKDSEEWREIFNKLLFLFTIWYLGAAETKEEFDVYYQTHFGSDLEKEEEKEEVDKEEEKELSKTKEV
jgi:hypothetical protein